MGAYGLDAATFEEAAASWGGMIGLDGATATHANIWYRIRGETVCQYVWRHDREDETAWMNGLWTDEPLSIEETNRFDCPQELLPRHWDDPRHTLTAGEVRWRDGRRVWEERRNVRSNDGGKDTK